MSLTFWRRYALAYAELVGSLLAPLVTLIVEHAAARLLAQPPAPPPAPTPEQRATMHASQLAGWLWDRYRDPAGDPHVSEHGRRMAILWAACLDDETVGWLAQQIHAEHTEAEDAPPLSHEVHH